MKTIIHLLGIFILPLCFISQANAIERHVPVPYPTIQSAIDSSNAGDVVIIADGTYTGSGNRDITCNKAITIRSKNGKQNCSIYCDGNPSSPHRGFYLNGGWAGIVIEGLSVFGGWQQRGGGIYCSNGFYTIRNCSISSNAAETEGGGIYCGTDSNPTIENCSISGNYFDSISNGTGAGIYIYNTIGSINNCTISGNDGASKGGGIYASQTIPLGISNCLITNNHAKDSGAGVYGNNGTVIMSNCEITQNSDSTMGGTEMRMGEGGGIALENCDEGTIIETCMIRENNVEHSGGGIYLTGSMPIRVADCKIVNNWASSSMNTCRGGGVFCDGGTAMMYNCVIADNMVSDYGGALDLGYGSSVELTNCTLSENFADTGAAIATTSASDYLLVTNSIIWNGTSGIHQAADSEIVINYSDVEGGWSGTGTSNIYANPLFVQQGTNYSYYPPIWGDYHLRWSSPCINQGDPDFPLPTELYPQPYCEKDIDEEPREMLGRIDMGFDEVGEKQADFTRNGTIDANDLSIFVQGWLSVPEDENWYLLLDLYIDNKIDFRDFAEFSKDWLWEASWFSGK